MKENYSNIERLILCSIRGELTEKEDKELKEWMGESEMNRLLYDRLASEDEFEKKLREYIAIDVEGALQKTRQRIEKTEHSRRLLWRVVPAAVAAVLAVLFLIPYIVDKPSNIIKTENIIAAGGSKAQLILSDGKVVDLGDGAKKQLSDGDGIIDVNDKTVSYQNSSLAKDNSADIAYNTVKTPRGGEYNLKLSDGTIVWLNSDSELKYPVSFAGKNRIVRVKGEAFFKVQKDAKRPFFVKTDDGLVRVLGTSFNIRNYDDEKSSVTTLVEGSISMKTANEELILKPGEQALVAEDGKVDVREVDTDVYTAWKDGRFVFRRQTLSEMMNTLSRWYDVNVFFEDNDSKRVLFTGNIERYDDFQKIIDMVEMMKKVEFKVKGNNIWIRRVKE